MRKENMQIAIWMHVYQAYPMDDVKIAKWYKDNGTSQNGINRLNKKRLTELFDIAESLPNNMGIGGYYCES